MTCHNLKHTAGTVESLIEEMQKLARKTSLSKKARSDLLKVLTYFTNRKDMMNCPFEYNLPIGSGVTDAACKTLVKQHFRNSALRWRKHGVQMVLTLRILVKLDDMWRDFNCSYIVWRLLLIVISLSGFG